MAAGRAVPQHLTFFRNLRVGEHTTLDHRLVAVSVFDTSCGECGAWFEQKQPLPADGVPTIELGKCNKRCRDCR